ncbi:MAG TPA: DinB family protein [Pyrinomonadaceae bacterium]|nr:DinB family protein [Pyrinomonadaceae bacterium]
MKLIRKDFPTIEGVKPEIARALAAMEEVREQLRRSVRDISDNDIARVALPGAHSIGALTLHIGEAEWFWMNCVILGHKLTDEDRRQPFWDVLDEPERFADKNYSTQFCLEKIDNIREETRKFLATLGDADLEKTYSHTRDETTMETNLRWILHHLVDHEAQHKGQILMLKRLLGLNNESWI